MLQDTLARTQGLDAAAPVVVCNEEHRFMVAEQLREMAVNPDALILEPEGRNTAPAVALAALRALEADAESVLLVLPADHVITDPDAFVAAVAKALPQAQAGRLMTFGVVPTQPETGYGYIKCGEALADDLFDLEQFVEKPDAETAAAYLASGDYLWNSGMFLLGAQAYLDELAKQAPEMLTSCRDAMAAAPAPASTTASIHAKISLVFARKRTSVRNHTTSSARRMPPARKLAPSRRWTAKPPRPRAGASSSGTAPSTARPLRAMPPRQST